jgi:hypothetical protein
MKNITFANIVKRVYENFKLDKAYCPLIDSILFGILYCTKMLSFSAIKVCEEFVKCI